MKESEFSTVGKIWYVLKQINIHPAYLLGPILLSMITAALEGVSLGLLIPILTGFLDRNFAFLIDAPYIGTVFNKLPSHILNDDKMLFGILLGGFVGMIIIKNCMKYFTVLSIAFFYQRCIHHLRKTLFSKFMSFGKLFFDTTNIGHHTTLLTEFTGQALRPVQVTDRLMNSMFSLVVYFGIMLSISWRLTLFSLPLFVLLYFMIRSMIFSIKRISREIAAQGSALGKKSVEILSTMTLVKSYRTEQLEQKLYTEISDKKSRLDLKTRMFQEMILPMQEIMTLIAATTIFAGTLYFFGRDQIASGPAIVVYFYVIINASHKFGALSGFRSALAVSSGPLDEIMKMFHEKDKFSVLGGSEVFHELHESIECRNLSFSYDQDRQVLDSLSFSFEKGKMTAIVGPTGAGKSTIINLLMRFYDCPSNSIFIDGTDIRSFTLDSYLDHIAIVSQETLLLSDSLRNNISYGLESVSEKEVIEAVEQARLTEFIDKLPEGLDTMIGDRGVKLSGGEKQRVSIARALLKGSEILILDEATSSLDSQTEKQIQDAIDAAVSGRTAIVIAHRLSTIKHADKIIALKDGRLAEQGTLDELLEKKGVFYALWQEQKF